MCNDTLNHKPQAMLFIKLAPGNVMWVTRQYVYTVTMVTKIIVYEIELSYICMLKIRS